MAEQGDLVERNVRYWGWADRRGEWMNAEVDTKAILDEIEGREDNEDRVVRLPQQRGLLGEVHRNLETNERTLILNRLEPTALLRVLHGHTIRTIELEEGAELIRPSWTRFHAGNHIGMLVGPGGPGKGDLERWLNGVGLFGDDRVTLQAIMSRPDYHTLARDVNRMNLAVFRVAPEQPIDIDESVLSEITGMLRSRLGDVSFELHVRANKTRDDRYEEEADMLQAEVGRIIESGHLEEFASAKIDYDSPNGRTLRELLESQVTAAVGVAMIGRTGITDARAAAALRVAYEQAEAFLTPAISAGDD